MEVYIIVIIVCVLISISVGVGVGVYMMNKSDDGIEGIYRSENTKSSGYQKIKITKEENTNDIKMVRGTDETILKFESEGKWIATRSESKTSIPTNSGSYYEITPLRITTITQIDGKHIKLTIKDTIDGHPSHDGYDYLVKE